MTDFDPNDVDGHYVLDEHGNPKPERNLARWAMWFEKHDRSRVIADDRDESDPKVTIRVSTVFLGLDHNYSKKGPPVLWETMVFGGLLDGEQRRYASRAAALEGHQEICERVNATLHHKDESR